MSSADSVPQQNTTDLLKNAQFAKAGAGAVPDAAPVSASDLLASAYDPARLHPLAGISDQVDYLMLDDDKLTDLPGSDTAIPSRGWSDDLCYGTGTMYLGGMSSTFCTESFVLSIAFFYMLCILSAIAIFTSYCLANSSHADPLYPQVWVWVDFGVFGRAPAGPSPCQTPVCESMPS